MGPMVDLHAIWSGRPLFDAGRLTGAVERQEVVVEGATPWAIYERNRGRLLAATAAFLRR